MSCILQLLTDSSSTMSVVISMLAFLVSARLFGFNESCFFSLGSGLLSLAITGLGVGARYCFAGGGILARAVGITWCSSSSRSSGGIITSAFTKYPWYWECSSPFPGLEALATGAGGLEGLATGTTSCFTSCFSDILEVALVTPAARFSAAGGLFSLMALGALLLKKGFFLLRGGEGGGVGPGLWEGDWFGVVPLR